MELRHLRYFIKAAELLHFTKAAEALFISQPTLSAHIQQLEEEVGTELFSRIGRSVRLTESGELFLGHARQSMRELEIAGEEINAIKGLLRGQLNVAALPLFSSAVLPGWMAEFNSLHPLVHIRARSGSSEDIEADLVSGSIDIGFGIMPVDHTELHTKELFGSEVHLIVSNEHPLANKEVIEAADLEGLPAAMASSRIASAKLMRDYFKDLGVSPNVIVEFDDAHALLNIARLGRLATFIAMTHPADGPGLRPLRLPGKGVQFIAVAMWSRLTPAAKAFLEVASSQNVRFQPLISG